MMEFIKKAIIGRTVFIQIIIYLFMHDGIYAQTIKPSFERITIKDGLTHSNITYIIQDKIGFMWFATYNGINRYDGHTIKTYTHNPNDSTSISHNGVIHLFEDKDGYIWIVNIGETGIDKYNPESDNFTRYAYNPEDSTSISSNEINHVMQDKLGNIWICANNALNLVIQKNNGDKITTHFKRYYYPTDRSQVRWAFEDKNGRLLLFSDHLMLFDRETCLFYDTQINITNSRVTSLAMDKSDNIYIGTLENGIVKLRYNKKSLEYERAPLEELSECSDRRNVVLIDNKDQFWIGTESKGLFKYNKNENRIENYTYNKLDPKSISDRFINSLNIDRSGILWIGTGSQGICKYDLFSKEFFRLESIQGEINSLSNNVIRGIDGNKPEELWVATPEGVNKVLFDQGGKSTVEHYYHKPYNDNSITSDNTLSLVQRKNGDVWVGSTGNSMSRIIPVPSGKENHVQIKRYPVQSWTFTLFEDSDGVLWGGTWGGGLWKYNDETSVFTYFINDPANPSSICENVVWALSEDKYKNIWIGGNSNGLSILPAREKGKTNPEFINFKFEKGNPKSLSSNSIHALHRDQKGTMWIGTSGGLNKVMDNGDFLRHCQGDKKLEFVFFGAKDGLPGDGIIGIVEDDDGSLWMTTSNGISKFDFTDSIFYNYSENDGLLSDEFLHNAFYRNSEGRIFFGGPNGITAFDPDKITANPFIPEIVITDFKLFNQSVEIGQKINKDIILTKPIFNTSEITLSHKNNRFTIVFAALHYAQPGKNQYAYYLEGFDEAWNYVENQYAASYSMLEAGKYTFRVKCSNNNGIWNEAGTVLSIRIKPPWWNTWLFRIVSLIFGSLVLFSIHSIKVAQIKKQNIDLENKVEERTREIDNKNKLLLSQSEELNNTNTLLEERQQQIEEQAKELVTANEQLTDSNNQLSELNSMKDKIFSIIGHDLKNPIGVILGFSDLLKTKIEPLSEEMYDQYVNYIFESANKTFQLLESLLNWARPQNKNSKIEPKEIKIEPLIHDIIHLLREQALKKNITINFENNNDGGIVFCDSRMVETVLRNLLSNAIKFTSPNGDITISTSKIQKSGFCTIHVADTGIGISEEQKSKLFSIEKSFSTEGTAGESGTGLGLVLCKEFVEKNKGEIWIESKEGFGTTFSFTLPLAKNT